MAADRAANVLYALMVLEADSVVDLPKLRDHIDAFLAGKASGVVTSPPGTAGAPTLATWGTSPDAQAGQDAMMRLLG
ncbi:MAG: hypothetical protein SHS37scaffold145_6 [Phage 71_18]|nr:MAG: hypothetical protein SHS37scaffold145_6 [Phage 71_18]